MVCGNEIIKLCAADAGSRLDTNDNGRLGTTISRPGSSQLIQPLSTTSGPRGPQDGGTTAPGWASSLVESR